MIGQVIFESLARARWLSDPATNSPNKLLVLKLAAACGLDIPDTLVSSDPVALSAFINERGGAVTKPIGELLRCVLGDTAVASYTSEVDTGMLTGRHGRRVFPTLLQERLDKAYEIRAFYLDGHFYCMAIFSQTDDQTASDFRRYHFLRMNRMVPYRLPEEVSDKLASLLERLGLETASVDLVKTKSGRFVFLEVNPAGQFGMVSYPCNYYLERAVASALVNRMNQSTSEES
jgi:ATP-GRASP peptide maturase of grasp-with-spasm system